MSQNTHIIDIRRSYNPLDPNSLASTYHTTEREDSPEPRIPVVPYDGYNFMPTPQGYASYFGINVSLEISNLIDSGGSGNVDDLFMIQTNTYNNILVALCDDGIWTKSAAVTGDWTQEIDLDPPDVGEHLNWTKCVIDNVLYTYRATNDKMYECGPATSYVFTEFTPTFLNMAGQLGIFKAGGRLGAWDSENSTGWSELGNTHSFTASPETLAGGSIFQDIVGRIVMIYPHGTGFVVYCTKSIVLVVRTPNAPSLFAGKAIFNNNGISYKDEVCCGEPDTQHYVMTTQGFVEISNGEAKFEIPEISTYFKEKRDPVYLKMLNGRYLFFPIIDPYYFNGIVKFHTEEFPPVSVTFKGASYAIEHVEESECKAFGSGMTQHEGIFLFNTEGITKKADATENAIVPIFEDNLDTIIPWAVLQAYHIYNVALFGTDQYFNDKYDAEGGIAKIDGSGTEYIIPTGMCLVSAYAYQTNIRVEANANSFWNRQEFLFMLENSFKSDWEYSLTHKNHGVITKTDAVSAGSNTNITHTYGPYLDISLFAERNRYYGFEEKSAWLQRSLTRGIYVDVVETLRSSVNAGFNPAATTEWTVSSGVGIFTTYTATVTAMTNGMNTAIAAHIASSPYNPGTGTGSYEAAPVPTIFTILSPTSMKIDGYYRTHVDQIVHLLSTYTATLTGAAPAGGAVPTYTLTQSFSIPKLRYTDYATCTYKEFGYTKIKGHGHYNEAGAFIVDDSTGEAADFIDICDSNPSKKKKPKFNGIAVADSGASGFMCAPQDVEIDDTTFSYPDEVVTIPGGTNFLQEGSIEPLYPTFLGAFIYDTQYKKWGKMLLSYKQLLDYFPINSVAGDTPIPYDTFLPKASAMLEDGLIYLFDQYPSDSFITYGKYGEYRKGFTDIEEVLVQHRTPMSGSVTVEGSLDGRSIEIGLSKTFEYTDARVASGGFSLSARWYNVTVEGNYDIVNLECRSSRKGKR